MKLTLLEKKLDSINISNSLLLIIRVFTGFFIRVHYAFWDVNFESF